MPVAAATRFVKVHSLEELDYGGAGPQWGTYLAGGGCGDGLNWYAYCSNNPVRHSDPTGMEIMNEEGEGATTETSITPTPTTQSPTAGDQYPPPDEEYLRRAEGNDLINLRDTELCPTGEYLNARKRGPHPGIDIEGDRGTPVYAEVDGIVKEIDRTSGPPGGKTIWVDSTPGGITKGIDIYYVHVEPIVVERQYVRRGQLIGYIANVEERPHLHLQVGPSVRSRNPFDYFSK